MYSDDFAADLRPAIRALRRLPMSGDEIVHLLVRLHPAAELPEDEDHSTFWMVVADQLHRSGIPSIATLKALDLIQSGTAIAAAADHGMEPRDLRKRAASLEKLAETLGQPPPVKKRSVLKKPQPLLLQPGEVYAYPADSCGNGINPYFPDAEIERHFEQTCWGSMLVSAAGHEFDFLAWYRVTRSRAYAADLPNFETAVSQIDPSRGAVGPLTANQLRRIRLHALGRIDGFAPISPEPEQVTYSVANSIAVSGTLDEWAQPGTFP